MRCPASVCADETPGHLPVAVLACPLSLYLSLAAEGGLERIVWMPEELKDDVAERLNETAKELYDIENFADMVADETVTCDAEKLLNGLTEKGHLVLGMEPLM